MEENVNIQSLKNVSTFGMICLWEPFCFEVINVGNYKATGNSSRVCHSEKLETSAVFNNIGIHKL
jgi:hypothetical protein